MPVAPYITFSRHKNYLKPTKNRMPMDGGEQTDGQAVPEESKSGAILAQRQEKVKKFLTEKPTYLVYALLALIAWFGYYIRTRNLGLLIDATTGKFIPADPDAIGILRYVNYIVEHGQLMSVDTMRYVPFGFPNLEEFAVISHAIAYFYKFIHFFSSTVTVEFADVVYPAVAFVIALIFFFLFLKKVFDWKVALLGSAFLTVVPAYLFRTMSGISDKEALAIAKRRLLKKNLNVELHEAFAESLPLPNASADVCFSTLAFHHMPNTIKQKAIQEIHRVLKPGGRVVIADFGATDSRWLRALLRLFEKIEYIEGNFKGLIPHYLKQADFQEIIVAKKHFPAIHIVIAHKM